MSVRTTGLYQDFSGVKLQELYVQAAEKVEEGLKHAMRATFALCDEDPIELGKHTEQTIRVEKEGDAIHDEIISRMYTKESLVFSRQDRGALIAAIDDLVDSADSAVRRASLYFPDAVPDLYVILREIARLVGQAGKESKLAILRLFDDFKKAKTHVQAIEDIKRKVVLLEHNFLKILYLTNPPMPDLLYFDRTSRKIVIIVKNAKHLASLINGLIFKYQF